MRKSQDPLQPTDVQNPNYFHNVVDCQWACPAHTNVPEYIRLIAQGRYTESYMLNRQSNVFPGDSGTHLRPAVRTGVPARTRGRKAGRDLPLEARGGGSEGRHRPSAAAESPARKNGKRIACVGAGPASLTVANDLMPLGYEVVMFEKSEKAGRPDALEHPGVPAAGQHHRRRDAGDSRHGRGDSLQLSGRAACAVLLQQGFDAVFVGTGAPRGKNLDIPGRYETDRIHIGIDWLESVAFGHIDSIGERVLIIGVGNTAMDCCRSSRRMGGKDIKVMARRPRSFFKASPWELDDAEEEGVEILINYAPSRFVVENGKLLGMEFERLEWDARRQAIDDRSTPCSCRLTT